MLSRKCGSGIHRPEQQHVVRVDHGGIGFLSMLFPHRSAVEARQGLGPCWHVPKRAYPDEAIRSLQIAELADNSHAGRFLGLDELAVEQLDQDVALPGVQGVLAKLDHRPGVVRQVITGVVHHVSFLVGSWNRSCYRNPPDLPPPGSESWPDAAAKVCLSTSAIEVWASCSRRAAAAASYTGPSTGRIPRPTGHAWFGSVRCMANSGSASTASYTASMLISSGLWARLQPAPAPRRTSTNPAR